VLMSVGIARRIDDYGISINRLFVLVFNVWLYVVSIYLFFTQSRHLRWLVVSFATILLLVSVGPWSVFAVTKRVVEKDLKMLLTENQLFVNNKLVDNKAGKQLLPDSVEAEISDKVYYYISNFGVENWKIAFSDSRKLTGAYQITESLGVDNYVLNEKKRYVNAENSQQQVFNIEGYRVVITNLVLKQDSSLIYLDKDYRIEFKENNIEITNLAKNSKMLFPIHNLVGELYSNNNDDALRNKSLVQKTENYMLIINSISAECKTSTDFKIQNLNFSFYIK